MELVRIEAGAMHGRVTAGAPTGSEAQESCVILAPDENPGVTRRRTCRLSVTFQAQIVVAFDQQLRIYRAVRMVADRAAFAHRFMLEDKRSGLFAMTLGTGFVESRHGKAADGFHNVAPVRIVALHAIHFSFNDRMMLRQGEFGVRLEMTLKAGGGVFTGIDDEFAAPAAAGDVFAAGAVAGFATVLPLPGLAVEAQASMRAGDKAA